MKKNVLEKEQCYYKNIWWNFSQFVNTIKDATVQLKICGISKLRTNKHVEKDVFSSIINFYV